MSFNIEQFSKSAHTSSPHCLLIGNPVSQSFSPLMHNTAAGYYDFELEYFAVQVQPQQLSLLASYLNNEHLQGANVTLPYKQVMLDYVDQLDATCEKIGALNTIVKSDYNLKGYNTDIYGFTEPLEPYFSEIEGTRAIIFGTGGAARAIVHGLRDIGAEEIVLVSRNPAKANTDNWPHFTQIISYDAWPSLADETSLFVNATPLGMEPNINKSPINNSEIPLLSNKICYDIVYKPLKTKFMRDAAEAGARTIGGLEMLIQQGSRSFELWTGKPFPLEEVRNVLAQHIQ